MLQLNPQHEKAWELLEKVRNTARQQSVDLEAPPERPPTSDRGRVEPAEDQGASGWNCPICEAGYEEPEPICKRCRCLVDPWRADEIMTHEGADRQWITRSIDRMSADHQEFSSNIALALGYLNLKNSRRALEQLEAALTLRPDDVALADVIAQIKRRRLVMVIDGSATVRELVSETLERHLIRVYGAADGLQAFDMLTEETPSLFLVEADSRVMDGYQICKILRKNDQTKGASVIIMDEDLGLQAKIRARMAGANSHLQKPFSEDALVGAVLDCVS